MSFWFANCLNICTLSDKPTLSSNFQFQSFMILQIHFMPSHEKILPWHVKGQSVSHCTNPHLIQLHVLSECVSSLVCWLIPCCNDICILHLDSAALKICRLNLPVVLFCLIRRGRRPSRICSPTWRMGGSCWTCWRVSLAMFWWVCVCVY